jgi:hypothetical protein
VYADGYPVDVQQRILPEVFHVNTSQLYGIEEEDADALKVDFCADYRSEFFQRRSGCTLLHGGYAEDQEKYRIQQYNTYYDDDEYTDNFSD